MSPPCAAGPNAHSRRCRCARNSTRVRGLSADAGGCAHRRGGHRHAAASPSAVAEAAFAQGKHVLCAKPLAESLESARVMHNLAAATTRVHGMDQQFRGIPPSRYLKDLLDEGVVGRPHSIVEQVHLNVWSYYAYHGGSPSKATWFTEPDGGGFLLATAQHLFDRLLWLFGPVRAVSGFTGSPSPESPATTAYVCRCARRTQPMRISNLPAA